MNVIDELVIALGLDGKGAKKGITDVKNSLNSGIAEMTSKLQGFAASFAAAFAVGAAFQNYTKEADAMGKLADSIGVTIENLHAWSEAAGRAGGSAEGFQASLKGLNAQLARVGLTGQSRAKMVLEGAGIDAGEIGRTRDAFAVLEDLAGKAEEMGKAEFAGLGQALGLDAGTIMLLQQGRQAVKDAVFAQKELGTYTKEDARVTADFNDRIADTMQAFKVFAAVVFRSVLPLFTALVKGFVGFISTLRKHETFVKAFFIGIAAVITAFAVPAILSLTAAILSNPITWLVGALALLAAVVEDLVVWAQGGKSAFADFWASIFGSPDEAMALFENIKQTAQSVFEDIKSFASDIFDGLKIAIDSIKPLFADIFDGLKIAIEGAKATLSNLFENVKEPAESMKSTFADVFDSVKVSVKSIAETLSQTFKEVFPAIKETAGALGETFSSLLDVIAPLGDALLTLAPIIVKVMGETSKLTFEALAAVAKVLAKITSATAELIAMTAKTIAKIAEIISSIVKTAVNVTNKVVQAFGDAFSFIADKWQSLTSNLSANVKVNANISGIGAGAAMTTGGGVSNYDSNTSVGTVNVYTQATDANGIARDMSGAIEDNVGGYWAMQADGGVW